MNDILFIQQDLGYGMTLYSFSRTKVMNDIVFIPQDQGYGMSFCSFSRT